MSSLKFAIFCGKCYCDVAPNSTAGGSVLSCGDFLCGMCAQALISGQACPACGKQGVRACFLNDSLPEDVKQNITDPTRDFQQLHAVLTFQVKYYKQLILRMTERIKQAEQDSTKKSLLEYDSCF